MVKSCFDHTCASFEARAEPPDTDGDVPRKMEGTGEREMDQRHGQRLKGVSGLAVQALQMPNFVRHEQRWDCRMVREAAEGPKPVGPVGAWENKPLLRGNGPTSNTSPPGKG